jgi:hypothetical protein
MNKIKLNIMTVFSAFHFIRILINFTLQILYIMVKEILYLNKVLRTLIFFTTLKCINKSEIAIENVYHIFNFLS